MLTIRYNFSKIFLIILVLSDCISNKDQKRRYYSPCLKAAVCSHDRKRRCGIEPKTKEVRRFIDKCDILEFNCEYGTIILVACVIVKIVSPHGPPLERDNEDIAMGRKMGAKWCSMAKVCNHDRVPICGLSHAGDVMGFRDLCDMFDYNCIRRRNYKQTTCPEDKSILTVSRRPTNSFYDE
ncbi:unnamed protein product [Euphydryas editha]|uniref:Uncharacterized protein n=1 Tax=Euphydryas editha TaxID=104508 RepID=A0AAU9U7U1_EUPED|nr:unnamed protein product [Euphydryas editha]